jgi:hypothetical protein
VKVDDDSNNYCYYQFINCFYYRFINYCYCQFISYCYSQFIIPYSVLRQAHSFFNREFCTDCGPVLTLSFSLISSSSCLRLLPRLPFISILPSICHSVMCFRRQFLRKMWPSQLAFLPFITCRIFLSPLKVCNTSFSTRSVQLISIILQQHISKRSKCFWSTFRSVLSVIST